MAENAVWRVTVLPSGVTVEAPDGRPLQEVLAEAGAEVPLPCGGQGRCGRCLVQVRAGDVRRRPSSRLSETQMAEGYALACQSWVAGDATLYVPPREALAIPEGAAAEKAAPAAATCAHEARPWVAKYHLQVTPPSLEDNTNDLDRLARELARAHGVRGLRAELPVLRILSPALRTRDWEVTAVVQHGSWDDPDGAPRLLDVLPGDAGSRTLGLAIDVGTTSVVVYLADLAGRELLAHSSAYNAQIACGEDVISRIIYSRREGGLQRLQELVVGTINALIDELLSEAGHTAQEVYWATVAGNPTMLHLFLGLDPQTIRLEPYILTVSQPPLVRARSLGLHMHPEGLVDCLPGVGAYVGADISAGVLRAGLADQEAVALFIDVGTNGEMVLGNGEWLISCACSAGPAFEGAGVASGMRAARGAIEEVWIDRRTAEPTWRTIGGTRPKGICGSGMISLLAEMYVTGVMDKAGRLDRTLSSPRLREGETGGEYVVAWASEADAEGRDIVITEADIQNLLRAKAAVYAGYSVLAESVGLEPGMVEEVLIGGAFGQYIDVEKAITIGLLPDMPWERFRYLGNTSVQGAYLCLQCREHRARVAELAGMMTYLELSADNRFMEAFTSAMFVPHTDLDRFPSVRSALVELSESDSA